MNERRRIGLREVRGLKPGEIVWDASVPGFGARRQKGLAVSYVLFYRTADRRQRWHTIGRHGAPWTPETAREEARRILGDVSKGADPASDRASRRIAPTVAELAERFLDEHAEAKRKARTAKEYRRLLENVVLPAIGKHKIADVKRHDIDRLHHARRATPTEANRALAVISAMFNIAERWGLRPDGSNPCRHVEKYPQRLRERMLSSAELGRLGDALTTYGGSPYVPAAVKLLVFTGARLGEVLGLEWAWIDFERGEARLPDSKSGAKTLHLPPPALGVLAELPRTRRQPARDRWSERRRCAGQPRKALAGDPQDSGAWRCAPSRFAACIRQRRRVERDGAANHRQNARPYSGLHYRTLRSFGERSGEICCCRCRGKDRRGYGRPTEEK